MLLKISENFAPRHHHATIRWLTLHGEEPSKIRGSHMHYLTQTFLLAIITIAAIPQVFATQDQWHQITDQEAGFTISFPANPTYEQSAEPSLTHQTEKYKFFYNGRLLQIIFAPLNKPLRTPTDLSDAFSEITRVHAKDGILLRQVKLPDGARQYDNVTTDASGTAYHRTRVYIRNGRYYAISYSIYATDGIDEREAARFFSTFKFTNELPVGRTAVRRTSNKALIDKARRRNWYTFHSPNGDFLVDFPGKPDYREFPNPVTGIPDCRYYFNFGENTFIVSYREVPAAATQPKEVMRRALERAIENNDEWHVLRHARIQGGGYYVESQGVVDGIPVYRTTKLYLRGNRLYHVSALTRNLIGSNKVDVVRFLSSFRLL